jgi:mercuric reductase
LAIVGSGGGAFAAAIAARRRSLRVVMIEHATIGGTCVNVGCIPSKALLAAAESRHRAGDARFTGIRTSAGPVDFGALIAAKDEIVDGLRQRKYRDIAADYGIDVLDGHARFIDGLTLDIDGRRIDAAHYLIATGAEAHIPDDVHGLADSGYLTSTTAMALDDLPESMIVIGGGYVAMEQAQLFSQLGTRVTILVRSSLARREEPELAHGIREAFTDQGIAVFEGVQPTVVRRDGDITVVAGDREFRAAQLLVATGRAPRTADLGLQAVGVETGGRGEVVVGDDLSTTNPRVWAAGDVAGHPQFV